MKGDRSVAAEYDLPESLASKTYGSLCPSLTKPLLTSPSDATMVLGPGEGGEEPYPIDVGASSSESSLSKSASDSAAMAADSAEAGVTRSSERLRLTAVSTRAPWG